MAVRQDQKVGKVTRRVPARMMYAWVCREMFERCLRSTNVAYAIGNSAARQNSWNELMVKPSPGQDTTMPWNCEQRMRSWSSYRMKKLNFTPDRYRTILSGVNPSAMQVSSLKKQWPGGSKNTVQMLIVNRKLSDDDWVVNRVGTRLQWGKLHRFSCWISCLDWSRSILC